LSTGVKKPEVLKPCQMAVSLIHTLILNSHIKLEYWVCFLSKAAIRKLLAKQKFQIYFRNFFSDLN
jgi:hypothetical protein